MKKLNLLPQCSSVQALIDVCLAAMPKLPKKEKEAMAKAVKEFETFGSPSLWSIGDVDASGFYGLTEEEKRKTLSRFIRQYNCKEADWVSLDQHASDVFSERAL